MKGMCLVNHRLVPERVIVVDDYNKNKMSETISSNVGDVFIGNDILGRISIEQSPNEIMINQSDKIFRQRYYLGPVTLRKMNIRLLNRFEDPIDINNNDLYMICTKACATAPFNASGVPIPTATTINPSWLLRLNDNTRRRSFSITAKKTGNAVITAPIQISNSVPGNPRAKAYIASFVVNADRAIVPVTLASG